MKIKIFILILIYSIVFSQSIEVTKIEPPNWWTNHTYNNIQLMVYGNNLDDAEVQVLSEKIELASVINTTNNNYLFINLKLDPNLLPGNYIITIKKENYVKKLSFPIYRRQNILKHFQGFNQDDIIYLITPDRFVNGDTKNDFIFNEKDEFKFRSLNGRHGGDLKGIIDKLDYLKELGITAIWITPVLENNMYMSYHGYAATDFYKVDPRFGSNELYKNLVTEAHKKGIKVILDHVANHIGINHPWIGNTPTTSWIHGTVDNHLPADHNKVAYYDIHASEKSKKSVSEGWFVNYMPDLNQTDTLLAKYIIQNTIWWIEFAGLDGIREDTYPYSDQYFMSYWAQEVLTHYPNLNIVGEVWKGEPSILSAFQAKNYYPQTIDSNLPCVTDFALRDALANYLSGKNDLHSIYEVLGQDFVYADPNNLLVFLDNHDTDRGMYLANGNLFKYKVALTIVLTTRGIPQIYYGTEIGLDGGGHHGRIRGEFPGGFGGNRDAFTKNGRNDLENEIFNFTNKLIHIRNKSDVLKSGELTQFSPRNNIYIYYKEIGSRRVLIIINDGDNLKEIFFEDYLNVNTNHSIITELLTDTQLGVNSKSVVVNKKTISIYSFE